MMNFKNPTLSEVGSFITPDPTSIIQIGDEYHVNFGFYDEFLDAFIFSIVEEKWDNLRDFFTVKLPCTYSIEQLKILKTMLLYTNCKISFDYDGVPVDSLSHFFDGKSFVESDIMKELKNAHLELCIENANFRWDGIAILCDERLSMNCDFDPAFAFFYTSLSLKR